MFDELIDTLEAVVIDVLEFFESLSLPSVPRFPFPRV
jgi:hypothetical protein